MKLFWHGVLGMNARNLKYIRTKNTEKSVGLADSKMKTKNFLSGRGIPFAETYALIASQQELGHFSFDTLSSEFVVKPNYGSKGQGILIVKKLKNGNFSVGGEEWTESEMRLHMTDTLGGVFSLYGNHDRVVVEELMRPGKEFSKFCRHGLADIRIIVYNFVPLTAMVRMPTKSSGGKANLAQGGIGLGLNIASGEVMSFFQHKRNYTKHFPDPWGFLEGVQLPFWDKILLYSSQIQFYTGLGYLALDWVITKSGPKLLEINARAGLEIQNVNLVPLAKRLDQVNDIKITSPEKGVAIAKALFGETGVNIAGKKMIHYLSRATIRSHEIIVKVAPELPKSQISPDLKKKFTKNSLIQFSAGVTLTLDEIPVLSENTEKNTLWLGANDLEDVIVVPKVAPNFESTQQSTRFSAEVISLDEKIQTLSKKLNLSAMLKPNNFDAELSKFLEAPQQYNPVFEYSFPDEQKYEEITQMFSDIETDMARLTHKNIAKLFRDKISELKDRFSLVMACKYEKYEEVYLANMRLFWAFRPKLLDESTKKILANSRKWNQKDDPKILGALLSSEQIIQKIEEYFAKNPHITPIPVNISDTTLSRMAIAYKSGLAHINIKSGAEIYEKELPAILAHEIGTHLVRYQNGVKNELKIFRSGTGYYLTDEEGLAVYNSLQFLPEGYEKNAMYFNYYLLSQMDTLSFVESATLLQSVYPRFTPEQIFSKVARFKRWIIRTETSGIRWTTYWKDKIYLDGFAHVSEWISEGGDASLLSFGKVKISDLPLVAKL